MCSATAAHTNVAVATNFRLTSTALVQAYMQQSQHQVTIVSGSTGKLYAQILHGAPFDLFLSADQARPLQLIESGLAVAGSRKTYAYGRLVLLGNRTVNLNSLTQGDFHHLAIANPKLAPYGVAAMQTLDYLGLSHQAQSKLVLGDSVGQAYAMVVTGNADLGLVAKSVVRVEDKANTWPIPISFHQPILQDLVMLTAGADNDAAQGFAEFVLSSRGQAVIEAFGYGTTNR
jgi:molybdenum ABC transporter molybdate-binding protein